MPFGCLPDERNGRPMLKINILKDIINRLLEERFKLVNKISEIDVQLESMYNELEKLT